MLTDEENLNNDVQTTGVYSSNSKSALTILKRLVKKIPKRKRLCDHELITLNSAACSVDLKKEHPLYPLINPLRDTVPLIGMGIKSSEVKKQVIDLIKSGSGNKKYKVPKDMDVSKLELWTQILIDNLKKNISNDNQPREKITGNMITHYMLIGEILYQMAKYISFKDTDKIPKELLVWIDTLIVWRHLFSHPERAPQLDLSNVDQEYVAYKLVENAKKDVDRDPYEILTHVHYPDYAEALLEILKEGIKWDEMVIAKHKRSAGDQEQQGDEQAAQKNQLSSESSSQQKNNNKGNVLKSDGASSAKQKYREANIPMRMLAYLKNKAEHVAKTPEKSEEILEKIYHEVAVVCEEAVPEKRIAAKFKNEVSFEEDLTNFFNGPIDKSEWFKLCDGIKNKKSKLSPEILQFYKERPGKEISDKDAQGKEINIQDHIFDTFLSEYGSSQQAHVSNKRIKHKTVGGVLQGAHQRVNLLTRILEKWAVDFQNSSDESGNEKSALSNFLYKKLKKGFLFFDACEEKAATLKLDPKNQDYVLTQFFKNLEYRPGPVFSEQMRAELLELRHEDKQTVQKEFYDCYRKALNLIKNTDYNFNDFIEAARGQTLPLLLDKWSNQFKQEYRIHQIFGMNEYSYEMLKSRLPNNTDDECKFLELVKKNPIDTSRIDSGKSNNVFTWITLVQKLMKDMSDPKDVTAIKDEQIYAENAQKNHMYKMRWGGIIPKSDKITKPAKLNSRKRALREIRGVNWMTSGWEARYQLTAYLINCKKFASPRLKDEYFDVFSVLKALRGLRAHAASPYTRLAISNLVKKQNIDQLEAYYISRAKLFVRDLMRENFYKIINYVYQTTPWHFFKGNPEKMKRFDIDKTLVEQLIPYSPKAKAKVKNNAQDIITKVSSGLASLILPDTPSLNDLGKEEAERVRRSVGKIITPALENRGITLFSSRAQAQSRKKIIFPIKEKNHGVIKNDIGNSNPQSVKGSVKKRATRVYKKPGITLLSPIGGNPPIIKKVEKSDPSSIMPSN